MRRAFSTTTRQLAKSRAARADRSRDMLDMANMPQLDGSFTRLQLDEMARKREIVNYVRLEQTQFPQLRAMRQKYRPPTTNEIVRVRHQHYQGEPHPAANKVDVTVSLDALRRTKALVSDAAAHKFRLIAGPRWDSVTDEVKIACEMFKQPEANERWCSDTLDKMIAEANDTKDTFEDVPLDTRPTESRLRKAKKDRQTTIADFPKEWLSPS